MKPLKYALFDMDGTLVDSMSEWMRSPIAYAHTLLPHMTPEQEELIYLTHDYEDIRALLLSWGAEVTVDALIHACEETMADCYANEIRAKRGTVSLLEELREAGVKMGIITMTPHRDVDVCLAATGLGKYFSFVLSTEDTSDGSGKEKPEIFGIALNKLGCTDPAECLFFEDSLYAVRTAHALGFHVIGVYDKWADNTAVEALADECINLD